MDAGFVAEADVMHAILVTRADILMDTPQGSDSVIELERITDALQAYEAKRWPSGKMPGGKG